jgi:dihydroxyacetone kinase-like protein
MRFTVEEAVRWIRNINEQIQLNKTYLTELDQAIGDGDHGLNMARGFQEVVQKVEQQTYEQVADLFKDVGMTLIAKVGGASGPLYGTVFMQMAKILKESQVTEFGALLPAFESALEGLKARGKAHLGDKTMVDVWEPVVRLLREEGDNLEPEQLAVLARAQMESTAELQAKKGRAAYLGPRSVGHIDPGAASSAMLFSALADVLQGGQTA